jgi:hypothetical protein
MTETRRAAARETRLMNMRTRKALGCAGLLAYLAAYVGLAVAVGATYAVTWPPWAQFLFYAVAGVIWIAPLKPLFEWMNRGE